MNRKIAPALTLTIILAVSMFFLINTKLTRADNSTNGNGFGVVTWAADNPVFPFGSGFDAGAVKNPSVIDVSGTYYMAFTASPYSGGGSWTIGLASSTDLISWTTIGEILAGTQSWENPAGVSAPDLVTVGSTVYCFYSSDAQFSPPCNIGVASCPISQIGNTSSWTKSQSNPVFSASSVSWSEGAVYDESVILVGSTYYTYFATGNGTIGVASTSATDFPYGWTLAVSSPVVSVGYPLQHPSVFTTPSSPNCYFMLTTSRIDQIPTINMYWSSDPLTSSWNVLPNGQPFMNYSSGWDSNGVGSPCAEMVGNTLNILFDGSGPSGGQIGLANCTTSSFDLVSPTPTPTSLPSPTLSVSCVSSTSYSSFKVEINGNLMANGTGISNAPVLIYYSITEGKSWQDLTLVNTGSDGGFSAEWLPSATGNYLINATYAGDSTYSSVSTVVTLVVMPFTLQNAQDVFSVASNSTVLALAFNSTSNELSFTVSGPSGTTGYVDAYIAKALIGDISTLKVYLDGNQLNYTATSQQDSWLIYFTYHHSTHTVVMSLGVEAAKHNIGIPAGIIAVGIAIGIAVAIVIIAFTWVVLNWRNRNKTKMT